MITFHRLDHLLITVPDGTREQARDFYTHQLELPEIPGNHPNNALWFQLGNIELHVREEAGIQLSDRHPAFEVLKLANAIKFLQDKGIEIQSATPIAGRQRCFFRDPFGNRFELLEFLQK